jgi:hypothetical protein
MGITAMGVAEAHIFRDPEQSKRQQYFELKRKNIQRVVKLARDRVLAREEKIFAGDDGARIAVGGRREDNIREALIRKVVQEALKRKFGE